MPLYPGPATTGSLGLITPEQVQQLEGLGEFGQEFQFEQDNDSSTTTSSTYQNKVTLTTSELTSGSYILFYSYLSQGSKNNTVWESRVQFNGDNIVEAVQRAVVAGSTFLNAGHQVLPSVSGSQAFNIDWRRSGGSGNASISNAHLTLFKINPEGF